MAVAALTAPATALAAELPSTADLVAYLREPRVAAALALGIGVGAVIAVLLRRRPANRDPVDQPVSDPSSQPNRPLGQWTGLCHALCVRTGARLVCIHISDDGFDATLKAAWQLHDNRQPMLSLFLPTNNV